MKNFILIPLTVALIGLIQISASAQADSEDLYAIDFAGGTINQYVTLVKDVTDGKEVLNIVVTESAENYKLPPVQVRASIEGVIGVIEGCSTAKNLIEVDTDVTGEVYIVRVEYEEPMSFTVDSVKDLLEVVDQTALLSAVEIGLEMQGSGSAVTMKLHEETGLLFVKGPESSVNLVHQVIDELEKGAHSGRGPGGGRGGARGGGGGR